jgi:hypothetical protein
MAPDLFSWGISLIILFCGVGVPLVVLLGKTTAHSKQ